MKLLELFLQEKQKNAKLPNMEECKMQKTYDFSNAIKNPYYSKLKQQITIRLDEKVIEYFKNMAEESGMSYQNIINYYLLDCVKKQKKLNVSFE